VSHAGNIDYFERDSLRLLTSISELINLPVRVIDMTDQADTGCYGEDHKYPAPGDLRLVHAATFIVFSISFTNPRNSSRRALSRSISVSHSKR
jgi:hypothetical protein